MFNYLPLVVDDNSTSLAINSDNQGMDIAVIPVVNIIDTSAAPAVQNVADYLQVNRGSGYGSNDIVQNAAGTDIPVTVAKATLNVLTPVAFDKFDGTQFRAHGNADLSDIGTAAGLLVLGRDRFPNRDSLLPILSGKHLLTEWNCFGAIGSATGAGVPTTVGTRVIDLGVDRTREIFIAFFLNGGSPPVTISAFNLEVSNDNSTYVNQAIAAFTCTDANNVQVQQFNDFTYRYIKVPTTTTFGMVVFNRRAVSRSDRSVNQVFYGAAD